MSTQGSGGGRELISSVNEEKNAHIVVDRQIIKIGGNMSKRKKFKTYFMWFTKKWIFFERKKLGFYFLMITLGNDWTWVEYSVSEKIWLQQSVRVERVFWLPPPPHPKFRFCWVTLEFFPSCWQLLACLLVELWTQQHMLTLWLALGKKGQTCRQLRDRRPLPDATWC